MQNDPSFTHNQNAIMSQLRILKEFAIWALKYFSSVLTPSLGPCVASTPKNLE